MSRIGRYEIEREIGRGQMATVYQAYDPRLGRRVAIKVFEPAASPASEQAKDLKQRFVQEGRAAAALAHPSIVAVFDVDDDSERNLAFIAMEYVPGKSLKTLLEERGRLTPEQAFEIIGELADALDAAHRLHIVHRDIKPANILIREPDGVAKIADFGVARLPGSALTQAGTMLGTPAYMSPEQIRGESTRGTSDLFSLAVVLYECLSGERPFQGDDLSSLMDHVVRHPHPPLTTRVPGLSSRLDEFFERALAKEAADRFQDGAAFRHALLEARAGCEPAGTATIVDAAVAVLPDRSSRSRMPTIAVLVASIACLAWLASRLGSKPQAGPPVGVPRVEITPPSVVVRKHDAPIRESRPSTRTAEEAPRSAHLDLEVRNFVEAGNLTLLADGKQVYSRWLTTTDSQGKVHRKNLFRRNHETFEARVDLAPGKHALLVRVEAEGRSLPYEARTMIDIGPGEARALHLVAGRAIGSALSLKLDAPHPGTEPVEEVSQAKEP